MALIIELDQNESVADTAIGLARLGITLEPGQVRIFIDSSNRTLRNIEQAFNENDVQHDYPIQVTDGEGDVLIIGVHPGLEASA